MTLFDPHTFGPGHGDHVIEPQRPPGELRRIVRWVRREHWSAQVVIALMVLAVCYIALVGGLLIGAGVSGFWSP
jgi:hypothetical protein